MSPRKLDAPVPKPSPNVGTVHGRNCNCRMCTAMREIGKV
jgi:hypothetical protein